MPVCSWVHFKRINVQRVPCKHVQEQCGGQSMHTMHVNSEVSRRLEQLRRSGDQHAMSQPLPRASRLRRHCIRYESTDMPSEPLQQRLGEGLHDVPVAADVHGRHGAHQRGAVRVPAGLRAGGRRGRRVHRLRAR